MRIRRFRMPCLLAVLLLVGAARGELRRSSGLIAEKTEWENPYYLVDSPVDGPTLLITAGLHGNEPAGSRAAEQIRHWPIRRGRLVVVPHVNAPGLRKNTRWLPGEAKATRNANRNFPKAGEPDEARSQPVRALWEFVKEQHPDWILDLHEGYDFHITNSKSDGSTIICCNTPEMQELAGKICDEVNVAIDDPGRKFVTLSKNGPIEGGLVRATVERLGAKGLCLETTYGKQPMSTRTRQHRIMVHHLMRELGMVDGGSAHVIAATGESPCIRVALYDAGGTGGQGVRNLERILESGPAFTLHHIGPPDIRHGVLDQFDVLIVPGGSGSKEAAALGPDGRDAIRRFVAEGGGYVGICAGAYLATARYDWALGLLNAKTFAGSREIPGVGVKSMWLRGTGKVNIELTEEGKKILGDLPGLIELQYANGPVLSPAGREDLPEYLPLAVFRSEIAKYEPQRGTMIETPAIAASQYGRGRAMVISPHPEVVAGLETLVQRAVDWAGRKHAAAATPGEQH